MSYFVHCQVAGEVGDELVDQIRAGWRGYLVGGSRPGLRVFDEPVGGGTAGERPLLLACPTVPRGVGCNACRGAG
jgi:hypothetical protein